MKFALRMGQFPNSPVLRVAIKHIPAARVTSQFFQMRTDKCVDSIARLIHNNLTVARNPFSSE